MDEQQSHEAGSPVAAAPASPTSSMDPERQKLDEEWLPEAGEEATPSRSSSEAAEGGEQPVAAAVGQQAQEAASSAFLQQLRQWYASHGAQLPVSAAGAALM